MSQALCPVNLTASQVGDQNAPFLVDSNGEVIRLLVVQGGPLADRHKWGGQGPL